MKNKKNAVIVILSIVLGIVLLSDIPLLAITISSISIGKVEHGTSTISSLGYTATQEGDPVADEKAAALIADGYLRSTNGWKTMFLKPYKVSFDEQNNCWIVESVGGFLGAIVGAEINPVVVIGKDGRIINHWAYCF
jgi:hypothetical protein